MLFYSNNYFFDNGNWFLTKTKDGSLFFIDEKKSLVGISYDKEYSEILQELNNSPYKNYVSDSKLIIKTEDIFFLDDNKISYHCMSFEKLFEKMDSQSLVVSSDFEYTKTLETFNSNKNAEFVVCLIGDKFIVGILRFEHVYFDVDNIYFSYISVHPLFRNRKIASKMIEIFINNIKNFNKIVTISPYSLDGDVKIKEVINKVASNSKVKVIESRFCSIFREHGNKLNEMSYEEFILVLNNLKNLSK